MNGEAAVGGGIGFVRGRASSVAGHAGYGELFRGQGNYLESWFHGGQYTRDVSGRKVSSRMLPK